MPEPVRPPESLLAKLGPALLSGSFPHRRLGRALAFQVLYEMDVSHHGLDEVLVRTRTSVEQEAQELGLAAEAVQGGLAYARELIQGVEAHRLDVDGIIRERAQAYPLPQMAAVDRNVLRLGLYEALFGNAKVPLKAAINEAVEMAKLFGSETSARFVNGVLGRAAEQHAGQRVTAAEPAPSVKPGPPANTLPIDADDEPPPAPMRELNASR